MYTYQLLCVQSARFTRTPPCRVACPSVSDGGCFIEDGVRHGVWGAVGDLKRSSGAFPRDWELH